MILHALAQYYERLKEDPESGIALPGFAPQKISFAIVLNEKGKLIRILDIRNQEGKKPKPVVLMLPYAGKRTSGILPNFLWDNTKYVLGIDKNGEPETKGAFQAFKEYHNTFSDHLGKDAGFFAVITFLNTWQPTEFKKLTECEELIGKNLVFILDTSHKFIHESEPIVNFWTEIAKQKESSNQGFCLVTGKHTSIEEVHFPIKGVYDPGGQAEKAIISFNKDAFCSYNKRQSLNAPVGYNAMFAYTTALNHLLRFDSIQKIQIGGTTTVFWTERKSPVENVWGEMFNPPNTDSADTKEVLDYLSAVREGKKPPGIDTSVKMYILGLSPNASRLAIRFWLTDTVDTFNRNLGKHFNNLRIQKQYENDKDFPGIWLLLIETLPKKKELRKSENINPLLSGMYIKSILSGGRYPESLLATLIRRLRTDGDVSYYRAAQIKAILKRNYRKEVSMGLDENNRNIAYRLGRLFAVLEKAQEEAIPGANATVKDRFYGSASATPGVVFPQLLRMGQHHLSKIGEGSRIAKEKMIQSIVEGIDSFPRNLPLEEQGLFSLGYYHQRNAFFKKKNTADEAVITK